MACQILVVKETRAGEQRVALIPKDVETLVKAGHHVFVEQDAGVGAGYENGAYEAVGAVIRSLVEETLEAYEQLFQDIDIVVRAKRPEHQREALENQSMASGTVMIGALDPLEKHSSHMQAYKKAGIVVYSIDQLDLPLDHPMNVLAAMSAMAGKLALRDALEKCQRSARYVFIIGFGVVGQTAFEEALTKGLVPSVLWRKTKDAAAIEARGGKIVPYEESITLREQQLLLLPELKKTDIVITSARRANQTSPILIPKTSLQQMQVGSVIVDMALSEGGNVEGSEHDATHVLGNHVIVTNTSGYPKAMPHEASILWSRASVLFLELFIKGEKSYV